MKFKSSQTLNLEHIKIRIKLCILQYGDGISTGIKDFR
jgi:hypothetical protein